MITRVEEYTNSITSPYILLYAHNRVQTVGRVFLYTMEIHAGHVVSLMHAMDHPGRRSMMEALAQRELR
jgi:hypothetical protein